MNNIIVGLGEILWDIFPDRKVLGGAPANFAYHISQLGYNGYTVSAIGNDILGKEILSSLDRKHLNYLIETTNYPTGTVQVSLDANGIPQYEIVENVAWDNIVYNRTIENLAKKTQAVCFGSLAQRNSISRQTIINFVKLMPEDSIKVFDINLRQYFYTKEVILESLQIANILKINDDEIIILSQLLDLENLNEQDICKYILNTYNLNILILTKGDRGSYVFTSEKVSYLDTPKVEIVDTVGAGDSFTAAFLASYLNNNSIISSHQLAVEVAAYVCTQRGAMPQLPPSFKANLEHNSYK